ncbi:acylphosphatase, partial [Candidatus Bathyarchaeota archaeon]|nr:acylphosphatase [Candidatus Bathyarchaeota archaeon]
SRRRVRGWVRNLRDGRVEALFEGEKENVQAMIEFCWRGPGLAKVKNVDVEWEPYVGDEELFETR